MLLTPAVAPAQAASLPARNAVYVELLGNGGRYSLNFERRIGWRTSVRAGMGKWTAYGLFNTDAVTNMVTIPVLVNVVRGSENHHAELGGGLLLGQYRQTGAVMGGKASMGFVTLTGVAGYRYQKRGPGMVFRAGITPFYSFAEEQDAYPDRGFTPAAGVSLGYAF